MPSTILVRTAAAAACLAFLPGRAAGQVAGVDLDTVRAGRFDYGKMWTFEYPPAEYFSETYGFDASPQWFERARMSALRIPGCSASFVSPFGLLATNHHCVRGRVAAVSRPGEQLLDEGFFARTLEAERRIPGYYADQLIAVRDISDEVFAAVDPVPEGEKGRAREEALEDIRARLKFDHSAEGDSIWVQVIGLYSGGRYSAYVFRRFTDVRLVAAAELQMGFFGGDPDNFTYPRYDLDFAFLRVYEGGEPYRTVHYFGWGDGVESGDAVFIIGNPGGTNRLRTVAQLEYQRDVEVPAALRLLSTRLAVLTEYRRARPDEARALDLRNAMFGLSNTHKAYTGRLAALGDPVIMARKADAERKLQAAIARDAALGAEYGMLFDRIAEIQAEKRALASEYGAFLSMGNGSRGSRFLPRAFAAHAYLEAVAAGAAADTVLVRLDELRGIPERPPGLDEGFLARRFSEFALYLGPDHAVTRAALGNASPGEAARRLLASSVLADREATLEAVEGGTLSPDDPALVLARKIDPVLKEYRASFGRLTAAEAQLEAKLGRVRFAVYGSSVPPDGSSSPRIADGVVKGYPYNGTLAPPYTTFYGLYDRYFSHGRGQGIGEEWDLPARWRTPPPGLDLGTPLDFVSTTDSYGGNSGSPAVTPRLELVGLNFDRNIEGLSRDFIYLPERGRNVMVDVRAIRAALDSVYDLDRILAEIETGRLFETEEAADAAA